MSWCVYLPTPSLFVALCRGVGQNPTFPLSTPSITERRRCREPDVLKSEEQQKINESSRHKRLSIVCVDCFQSQSSPSYPVKNRPSSARCATSYRRRRRRNLGEQSCLGVVINARRRFRVAKYSDRPFVGQRSPPIIRITSFPISHFNPFQFFVQLVEGMDTNPSRHNLCVWDFKLWGWKSPLKRQSIVE